MRRIRVLFLVILMLAGHEIIAECTVAVVSGRATVDGRPLLWKNRDSSHRENRLRFFSGPGYDFIGVINAGDSTQVWMGVNSAGLAIMNSESKDLEGTEYDDEGYLMKHALGNFASIREFRGYLDSTNQAGRSVTSNFGLIDARGEGGFFETGNHTYTYFDATDSVTAPSGILTRANFAETGNGQGYGYYRCGRADSLLHRAFQENRLDTRYILQEVARDITTGKAEESDVGTGSRVTVNTAGTVNRHRTVSSAVFHGVKPGEDPALSTMWVILGEPIAGISLPFWVAAGGTGLPDYGELLNHAIQGIEERLYTSEGTPEMMDLAELPRFLPLNLRVEELIIRRTKEFLDHWRKQGGYAGEVLRYQRELPGWVVPLLQYEAGDFGP